ncbi:MAG: FKBP-type peptidyl-prolyl cis-trans isomerase [Chitinophagales bacterium]|nr:FKBP-type peptidyl-prolyl cis-trans isomerase [Chitinophagales bacterium]
MIKQYFSFCILLASIIFITSCSKTDDDYKVSPNKLKYKIIVDNKKPKAKFGEYVTYNIIWKTLKDSLLFSSKDSNQPLVSLVARPVFEGDPWEIFTMIGDGDSASVKVPAEIIFKKYLPKNLQPNDLIVMDIKVLSVMNQHAYDSVSIAKLNQQLNREGDLLEAYVGEKNLIAKKTSTGLYVVIEKEGTGKQPTTGNTVKVNYTGRTLNGYIFDSSLKPGRLPYEFTIGTPNIIQGWNEGLQHFSKGGKGKLLIPSELAYGERGNPPAIGPNEPLVFDIELLEIK